MRNLLLASLLLACFLCLPGLSLANEDVDGDVASLQYQIDSLREELNARPARRATSYTSEKNDALNAQKHEEVMQLLRYHTEMIQWIGKRLETIPAPVTSVTPGVPLSKPVALAPTTTQTHAVSDRSIMSPTVALPKVTSATPDRLVIFSLVFSALSFISMLVFSSKMRRRERELRRMIVTSDVEDIRADMRRFSEKVSDEDRPRLKLSINGQNLDLYNMGNAAAEDLKIFIGPSPSSLKKRVETDHFIGEGERLTVLLPPRTSEQPIYATLEYKNATSDRSYKDQFVLKTDRLTGLLMPIQEAS